MIEFELKYQIAEPDRLRALTAGEKFSVQRDIYYDTQGGMLYQSGNFLRMRDDRRIDCKLFVGDDTHLFCEETNFAVESISSANRAFEQLCRYVGLVGGPFSSFEEFVDSRSLVVLAPIVKRRCQIRQEDIILSIDEIDGLGTYLEAELDFPDAQFDPAAARKELEQRLFKEGLVDPHVDKYVKIGYVELYLKQKFPSLYEMGKYKE